MLRWSDDAYQFTFGLGSLAIAGMLSEHWGAVLPAWGMLTIALLPLPVSVSHTFTMLSRIDSHPLFQPEHRNLGRLGEGAHTDRPER
jgi:hypothetical protein